MSKPITFDLSGHVAIVTGGTGALGSSISRGFLNAGAATIVTHFNDEAGVERLSQEFASLPGNCHFVSCDVRDPDSIASLRAEAVATFGQPTILVNNAGVMDERSLADTTPEIWQRTIDTNLTGTFLMSRAFVPGMQEAGGGSIVNIASQVPFRGGLNLVSYAAAKAGIVGMTRALAREIGPTVRVNAVAPGPLDTPLVAPFLTPEWVAQRAGSLVTQELGNVDDITPSVLFLCTPAAHLYQGQTLHANGGGVML